MLQFGNMSDELTRHNSELFADKVAPSLRHRFSDVRRPLVAGDRAVTAPGGSSTSPGIAGHPANSPALDLARRCRLGDRRARAPGFDGRPGFKPPDDHLGWLTVVWDALDATGALPCPVVGASAGGMIAADLAVFRPEAVTALALLAPFGIFDDANPGVDLYSVPTAERMEHLFAKGVQSRSSTASATSAPTRARSPAISATSPRQACCGRSATAARPAGSIG